MAGPLCVRVLGGQEALHAARPVWMRRCTAVVFPQAGIVCRHRLTIAVAENAVQNGAHLSLDTCVAGMDVENGRNPCRCATDRVQCARASSSMRRVCLAGT